LSPSVRVVLRFGRPPALRTRVPVSRLAQLPLWSALRRRCLAGFGGDTWRAAYRAIRFHGPEGVSRGRVVRAFGLGPRGLGIASIFRLGDPVNRCSRAHRGCRGFGGFGGGATGPGAAVRAVGVSPNTVALRFRSLRFRWRRPRGGRSRPADRAHGDPPRGVAGALAGAFDLEPAVLAFDDAGVRPRLAARHGLSGDLGAAGLERVLKPGGGEILGA
jgi:hypothetical protein